MKIAILYYYNTDREEEECSILSVNHFPDDATDDEIFEALNPKGFKYLCILINPVVRNFIPTTKKLFVPDDTTTEKVK